MDYLSTREVARLLHVSVSLLTPLPDPAQIEGLTWKNPLQVVSQGRVTGLMDPRVIAGLLLLVMVVLYYVLR